MLAFDKGHFMSFENVIDATDVFMARKNKMKTLIVEKNLGNNMAFRAYCECIGQLAMEIFSQSDYCDKDILDEMFNLPSADIVDVTMNEPVTVTAKKLAEEIIKECVAAGVKVRVESISFRKIIVGETPEKVSLNMRMGSRTA
jgi:hypothetical protein